MPAYLLLLLAVLSRVLLATTPHHAWFNFTALGGALLFFGARRSWREMAAPLAVLIATDFYLTTQVYNYPFQWEAYLPTWLWYVAAMALGSILLHSRTTVVRVGAGALLGPTSFFLMSNFAVWAMVSQNPQGMYARSVQGLVACYAAGVPFYRNDLVSTGLLCAAVFGLPALVRRFSAAPALQQPAK